MTVNKKLSLGKSSKTSSSRHQILATSTKGERHYYQILKELWEKAQFLKLGFKD